MTGVNPRLSRFWCGAMRDSPEMEKTSRLEVDGPERRRMNGDDGLGRLRWRGAHGAVTRQPQVAWAQITTAGGWRKKNRVGEEGR